MVRSGALFQDNMHSSEKLNLLLKITGMYYFLTRNLKLYFLPLLNVFIGKHLVSQIELY